MLPSPRTLLALLTLAVLVCTPPAWAAEEPAKPGQPRAILIGINKYEDKQIKSRVHAEDDAVALYKLFTDKGTLGADPKNVKLLLGDSTKEKNSEKATRANIIKAVQWLAKESGKDDLALLVFIGEGGPLGAKSERRCYFASDSTFAEREKNAVAAADIEEALKSLKSRHFAAFVDVNFKGFDPGKENVADATLGNAPYREFLGDDGTDEHNFIAGRSLFLATNGLSVSLDLKEHGLFTQVLLDGMKGGADVEGYEPDGVITSEELTIYLGKNISKLAREFGKTVQEKAQLHFVLGDRSSEFVLMNNPAVIAKVRERLEKFEKLVKDSKLPERVADEGRKLLGQMPKLKAQQELRKSYQQLVDGGLKVAEFETKRNEILESLKLDRATAEKFADKVLDGSQLLLDEFVRKVERGELIGYAIRGLYRRVDEKISDELDQRLKDAKKANRKQLKELLVDARLALGKREDLDGQKDVDIALQRMFNQLGDPYSTYVDPDTLDQFQKATQGNFTGIGVQIRKDRDSDMLLVVTPLKGSPAYRAGMKAGDLITTITLEVDKFGKKLPKPEILSTRGLGINDAVAKIVGKPGTKVKVTIKRPGEEKPREFEIERGRIEVETVMGAQRRDDDEWSFMIDAKNKIGYIRLTQFTRNTYPSLLEAMKGKKDATGKTIVPGLLDLGLKGLVLDVRFNPGGLLFSAKEICDLFIDDGLIVSIRPREGPEDKLPGQSEGSELGFPMVVLVNGGSASGSEIVAACLQDHGRAIVVGERSYGKGSVQNVVPFAGGEVKLTTASFWRPNGRNLNKASTKGRDEDEWGVSPNKGYELKLSFKEAEDLEEHLHDTEVIIPKGTPRKQANPAFRDRQLEMGLKYLREQIQMTEKAKGDKTE